MQPHITVPILREHRLWCTRGDVLIINTTTLSVYACVVLEIILGNGGVETVEALRSEGAPLSAALLTSFRFIDFELSSKTDKKKQ